MLLLESLMRKKYGGVAKIKTTPIPVEPFKYDPTNVRSTFLSLVTKTYPHGHEKELLQFLPKLDKDRFGNYYKIYRVMIQRCLHHT
jgi:hypothetical protein